MNPGVNKTRTFTVLIMESSDQDISDEQALSDFVERMQEAYDQELLPGSMFLVLGVKDENHFWEEMAHA